MATETRDLKGELRSIRLADLKTHALNPRTDVGDLAESDPKRCRDCFGRASAFGWQHMVDAQRGRAASDHAMDPRD